MADWPVHGVLCSAFKDISSAPRPTDRHFRAILFPVDEPRPKFFWFSPDYCHEFLVGPGASAAKWNIRLNLATRKRLVGTLCLCINEKA